MWYTVHKIVLSTAAGSVRYISKCLNWNIFPGYWRKEQCPIFLSTNLQIFSCCPYRTCNITEGNTTIPALATVQSTSDHNTTTNTTTTNLPTAVQNLSRLPTGDDIGDVVCSPPPSYLPPDVRTLSQYHTVHLVFSVADTDPVSSAFLTLESGIRIRDPGWKKIRIRDEHPR